MRVAECLVRAAGRIPRSDARVLLAAVLGKPKEFLIAHSDAELSDSQAERFESYVERAQRGEPIPYIVGVQEFWGRSFAVTPATLIPRPDTETLIEEALTILRDKPASRVLDLGTGSGCIAVTLALECPSAQVFACDKSDRALSVAQRNTDSLKARVRFDQSDWFSAYADQTFDLIVSNPPYIEENDAHLAACRPSAFWPRRPPATWRPAAAFSSSTATIRASRPPRFSGRRALKTCARSSIWAATPACVARSTNLF